LQLVNSTIEDVKVKEQLSYDSVLGVLERCIRAKVDWSAYTALGILGIDEIALKKGHRDFVVIVTARLVQPLFVGDNSPVSGDMVRWRIVPSFTGIRHHP
jgi:hypothetical protein